MPGNRTRLNLEKIQNIPQRAVDLIRQILLVFCMLGSITSQPGDSMAVRVMGDKASKYPQDLPRLVSRRSSARIPDKEHLSFKSPILLTGLLDQPWDPFSTNIPGYGLDFTALAWLYGSVGEGIITEQ